MIAPHHLLPQEITKGQIYTPGTSAHFKEMIQRHDRVVVDFYADWCHGCKQLHKIMDQLAQDSELESILFVKINTEEHRMLVHEFQIYTLPTIIFFHDGSIIHTVYGYHDKKKIKQIIKNTFFH